MPVKVMTYNILDGGENRESLLLEVFKAKQPDVIILQEVFQEGLIQEFAKALNMDYFFAKGNNIRHLALLSRLPIVSPRNHHPFPIRCAVLEATIEFASNYHVQLFGVHLAPFVAFYREWWRTWELKIILRKAMQYNNIPCLIAGDFNAIAPNDRVEWVDSIPSSLKWTLRMQGWRVFHWALAQPLAAGFTDSYRFLHPKEDGFTLPTPEPHARLDYIFVNDILKANLQQCDVVCDIEAVHRASDHYPVLAEFAV